MLPLLLALALLLGSILLIGCADDQTPDDPDLPNNGPDDNNNQNPDDEIDENEQRVPTDLPEKTFDGAAYHIFQWTYGGMYTAGTRIVPWEEGDVESRSGDLLVNAVYDRNRAIEQTYDVVISMEYGSVDSQGTPYMSTIRTNHKTGDDRFQLITLRSLQTCELTLEGLMLDMTKSDYINFDKPWWNDDSVESLRIGSGVYWAISELLVRDKAATACIFYNTRIAENNGITNLYQLSYDGQWTMDALIEAAENCYFDNGNGVADDDDVWGAVCGYDTINYMYNGAGLKFAEINDEGYPEFVFGDDKSISTLIDVLEYVMYAEWYANTRLTATKDVQFEDDNVLFRFGMVKDVTTYRSMQTAYGVLPIPKYDEYQDDYSSLVWMHHDCVLGIPAIVQDPDMAQIITEALSAESYYTVYRDFYDTVILGRSARDQESKEMLEIIFNTRSIDPGLLWDSTNFRNDVLEISKSGSSDIASLWARYNNAIDSLFNETIPQKIAALN